LAGSGFQVNAVGDSCQFRLLFLQDAVPFFAQFGAATHSFVPDNGEIGAGGEILRHRDGRVQVQDHVPVTTRHKNSLSRILYKLNLKEKYEL